ncbi:MAG: epimerase [Myxococcota bacterium]
MRVVIYGASGMIGQGVLLECLDDPEIEQVLVIGRSPVGQTHAKLTERLLADMYDQSAIAEDLRGLDACYFCLGVSAAGMSEADYARLTFDLTLYSAKLLLEKSPQICFCYVSGAGTDSSEKGRAMWARVKGKTENALLGLGFQKAYMFRPGLIQPRRGIKSKTPAYRAFYAVAWPLLPIFGALAPKQFTTTERIGRAMIQVARRGYEKKLLDPVDINALAAAR